MESSPHSGGRQSGIRHGVEHSCTRQKAILLQIQRAQSMYIVIYKFVHVLYVLVKQIANYK